METPQQRKENHCSIHAAAAWAYAIGCVNTKTVFAFHADPTMVGNKKVWKRLDVNTHTDENLQKPLKHENLQKNIWNT